MKQTKVLLDVEKGIENQYGVFNPSPLSLCDDHDNFWSCSFRRFCGGPADGVDILKLNNGRLTLEILPTRGMGIWRGTCGEIDLRWKSPVIGPVHPRFVPIFDGDGAGWLEGFDEWLVRCGLESNGAQELKPNGQLAYPLHGRLANIPAHYLEWSVDDDNGELCVTGKVRESRLFRKNLELESSVIMRVGDSSFTVRDRITNLSSEFAEIEYLYHINTGYPFLPPGSRLYVPYRRLAPHNAVAAGVLSEWDRLTEESPGNPEVVFLLDPLEDESGTCRALLTPAGEQQAIMLSFQKSQCPCFSFWKSRLTHQDGAVCGLEPATNFPNTRSFEASNGRTVRLEPGESRVFELRFDLLTEANAVYNARNQLQQLQQSVHGIIDAVPPPTWSEESYS